MADDSSFTYQGDSRHMASDPFKFDSGLLDDSDIIITDALFAFDPEYRDGQVLRLELTANTDEGEERLLLGCGTGWGTVDKGQTAQRDDGRDKNFHQNTAVAILMAGTRDQDGKKHAGLVGLMEGDRKVADAVAAKVKEFPGGPKEAGFYKSLGVHVTRVTIDSGDAEIGTYDRLVIDGFNGWQSTGAAKAAGATKKAAGKSKAKVAPAADGDAYTMPDELRAKLDAIADAADSHDEFVEQAIAEVPEVSADENVKAAVLDGETEGGIWAAACDRAAG